MSLDLGGIVEIDGHELRRLRDEAGLSRDRLAARSGVPSQTIYRSETLRTNPHFSTVEALAKVLGVDPLHLLTPYFRERLSVVHDYDGEVA